MSDAALLIGAVASAAVGLAWLALSLDTHWRQVRARHPLSRRTALTLRALGAAALVLSLVLCLCADHATMAALVWVMALAAGALAVAFTLAWRPRLLGLLIFWARAG